MAEEPTYVSRIVDSADGKGDCDRVCKKVLATKEIAAHILKEVVSEYAGCSTDDIINYISDVKIGQEAVDVDELPPVINMTNTEDSTILEGRRFYDIKFKTSAPGEKGKNIDLIINIEAQNNYSPGYSILRRGIYYCARLISSQYGTTFTGSKYDALQKVYSIWICTNPDKAHKNTIVRYKISPEELFNSISFEDDESENKEKQSYDMISLVMICLDNYKDGKFSENGIIKMLSVLLSNDITKEQKKKILENDCHIRMTKETEEEVELMCNLSQGYYENGLEKGRQEGRQEGRQKARQDIIINALKNGKAPEEIADFMGIAVEKVKEIEKQLYVSG